MIATELHPDTRTLIDLLLASPVGQIVTLGAMSEAIGRDIERCRYVLYSAIRNVERTHGAVFSCIRKEGYRRLPAEDIATIGKTARERIRHTARRTVKTLEAGLAGANDVPNEVRVKVLREQSALAMIEHVTRERNLPVVPEASNKPLPVAVTGREFLRAIGVRDA